MMHKLLLIALSSTLAVGCVQREYRTAQIEDGETQDIGESLDCNLIFKGLTDKRSGSGTIGPSSHAYNVENLTEFLAAEIDSMDASWNGTESLSVELRHAYARGKAMRGFYTIVLTARIGNDPQVVARGSYNMTNWSGTTREFELGMTRAASNALQDLKTFLLESGHCTAA